MRPPALGLHAIATVSNLQLSDQQLHILLQSSPCMRQLRLSFLPLQGEKAAEYLPYSLRLLMSADMAGVAMMAFIPT